eukprot:TRINITY_DN15653_c0_g1_i1.p1 TRINITY_DN15653_c0_g1~~TRINITY_DN15653_c0_g1_i1.p1  ORF type:complete len:416 (-),score=58.20 TRINITY_DN15653_c0_g1_i1:60-1250(-)
MCIRDRSIAMEYLRKNFNATTAFKLSFLSKPHALFGPAQYEEFKSELVKKLLNTDVTKDLAEAASILAVLCTSIKAATTLREVYDDRVLSSKVNFILRESNLSQLLEMPKYQQLAFLQALWSLRVKVSSSAGMLLSRRILDSRLKLRILLDVITQLLVIEAIGYREIEGIIHEFVIPKLKKVNKEWKFYRNARKRRFLHSFSRFLANLPMQLGRDCSISFINVIEEMLTLPFMTKVLSDVKALDIFQIRNFVQAQNLWNFISNHDERINRLFPTNELRYWLIIRAYSNELRLGLSAPSNTERKIAGTLYSLGYTFVPNQYVQLYEVDFFFPNNTVLDYHGLHHYHLGTRMLAKDHETKKAYFECLGYTYKFIPYFEWHNTEGHTRQIEYLLSLIHI